jgi:hypothetical protein
VLFEKADCKNCFSIRIVVFELLCLTEIVVVSKIIGLILIMLTSIYVPLSGNHSVMPVVKMSGFTLFC